MKLKQAPASAVSEEQWGDATCEPSFPVQFKKCRWMQSAAGVVSANSEEHSKPN